MEPVSFGQKYVPDPEDRDAPRQVSTWLSPARMVALLFVVVIVLAIVMAVTRGGGIRWLFLMKVVKEGPLDEISIVLAPLLGLALAIERIVETAFDMFEQATAEVAKLGNAGLEGLQWFQKELDRAWVAAKDLAEQLGQPGSETHDATLAKLKEAEQRIIDANSRIAGLVKDPKYVSIKRIIAVSISLLLGLIVTIASDTGICELLQISVPRIVDMVLTGFVIGAGSGPMHSLVGILQGGKDALAKLGDLGSLEPRRK